MSGRIKRPLDRQVNVRDASLFVIATEGARTEPEYFRAFNTPRVQVVTLPTEADGKSAPKHVADRASDLRRKYDLGPEDDLWVVIDFDRWGPAQLSEVAKMATKRRFKLAVSRPCFELWLWLHLDSWTPDEIATADALERALRARLGEWQKSRPEVQRFLPGVDQAVERAESLDAPGTDRWPQSTGSHVYKLVRALTARR